MRLWTLHPCYLDTRGLVALWREALLARAVLRGLTRGYRHHPQLQRFRAHPAPADAIESYLAAVLAEADARGHAFDRTKLALPCPEAAPIAATAGQLAWEWTHLVAKLRQRDPAWLARWQAVALPRCHPLFAPCAGPVAPWERG